MTDPKSKSGNAPSAKTTLRQAALARRDALGPDRRATASAAIAARAIAVVEGASPRSIASYLPIRSECDPGAIAAWAIGRGITVALPAAIDANTIVFRKYVPGDPLGAGGFGTLAPTPDAPAIDPDFIVAPVVGFDRRGARLGHGRGFYDRAVAALHARGLTPPFLGVAFAAQEVGSAASEPHDVRLDWIVTENETIDLRETA
jgi:5-formyltetrahydrofolate cyclo-ligase